MSNIVSREEVANNNNWYSVKEMCDSCQVSRQTWENFKSDFSCKIDFTTENCITGAHNTKYYSESILKEFQQWLIKNNGTKTSEVIKTQAKQSLEFGLTGKVIINSGNVEAANEFAKLIVQATQYQKDLLEQQAKTQQLQLENDTMRTTLQYDKVKGWHKWSDLKRDWKPHCEKLKKGRYETIFKEAGLEYGKDYEEIIYADCQFPTCMVSPTALPKLISYLGISIQ